MRYALVFLFVVLAQLVSGQADNCLPAKPSDQAHLVFQYTALLSDFEADRLDSKLTRFAQETSNRIAVVVVDELCGYDAGDFAFQLGENWGIGGKKDNGVLVLVKPTGSPGERKVFIATGYGLEGAIPDALCGRIVNEEIIPRFKERAFFEGLDAGTDVLMKLAKGEITEESYGSGPSRLPGLAVFALVALIIVIALVAQRSRVKRYAHTNNIDFWSAWWLLNQASRNHRGSWGGFTGGGGGGSGGFGGFGGGSFGGGGAGGSW